MSIQYQDDSFGEVLPLSEAMERFRDELPTGQVKALHVGTPEELHKRKEEVNLQKRLRACEDELQQMRLRQSGLVEIPTARQVKEILGE